MGLGGLSKEQMLTLLWLKARRLRRRAREDARRSVPPSDPAVAAAPPTGRIRRQRTLEEPGPGALSAGAKALGVGVIAQSQNPDERNEAAELDKQTSNSKERGVARGETTETQLLAQGVRNRANAYAKQLEQVVKEDKYINPDHVRRWNEHKDLKLLGSMRPADMESAIQQLRDTSDFKNWTSQGQHNLPAAPGVQRTIDVELPGNDPVQVPQTLANRAADILRRFKNAVIPSAVEITDAAMPYVAAYFITLLTQAQLGYNPLQYISMASTAGRRRRHRKLELQQQRSVHHRKRRSLSARVSTWAASRNRKRSAARSRSSSCGSRSRPYGASSTHGRFPKRKRRAPVRKSGRASARASSSY